MLIEKSDINFSIVKIKIQKNIIITIKRKREKYSVRTTYNIIATDAINDLLTQCSEFTFTKLIQKCTLNQILWIWCVLTIISYSAVQYFKFKVIFQVYFKILIGEKFDGSPMWLYIPCKSTISSLLSSEVYIYLDVMVLIAM